MQQSFLRGSAGSVRYWGYPKRAMCPTSSRFATNQAAAVGSEQVKMRNDDGVLSHAISDREPSLKRLIEPLEAKARDLQLAKVASSVATVKEVDAAIIEGGPLPFEEVPGPAVLKLWEKYWRYVPLLGTQLFSSLLINGLVEGRLHWNRNITPIKYLFNEYGPIVRINGPLTGDIVLIHKPEHIAKVFEEEGDAPVRSMIDILQHYRLHYRKNRFIGPFSAQGVQAVEWLQTKKLLEVPMAEQINKQFAKVEMACDDLILRIRQIKNRQDEVPGTFINDISRWSLESFWALMLNKKMGFLDSSSYNENSEATKFIEALKEAHLYMSRCETGFQVWRFFETPFNRRLFSACDVIDGVIAKFIRMVQSETRMDPALQEESATSRMSVLESLFKQGMSPEDISTIMMDMIILGVQATTNTQAFLLYYLAKNPRVQRTVYDELMNVTEKDPLITKQSLDKMTYLSACIKECLRLRPPFPYLTRQIPNNFVLHGYKIPKGTFIIMANQITSQREENFEDADRFKPERWLNDKESTHPQNSYLPFGKGLRACMGEQMSKLEMKLLTAKLIREFKIEYDYADIKSSFYMINVPNKPLRFRFVERD